MRDLDPEIDCMCDACADACTPRNYTDADGRVYETRPHPSDPQMVELRGPSGLTLAFVMFDQIDRMMSDTGLFGECVSANGDCDGPVTFAPCPFAADVHNDDTPMWICRWHRDDRADDI